MKFDYVSIDFEYANRMQFACQLGIVTVLDGQIVDEIEYLIKPPFNMYDPNMIRVHNITPGMTENAPTFEDIWDEIEVYFENQNILCHSASTDITVLKKNLNEYDLPIPKFIVLDTIDIIGKYKLKDLCKAYDVELTNAHNALSDAKALAKVYQKHKSGIRPEIEQSAPKSKAKPKYEKLKDRSLLVQDLNVEDKSNPFYNKKVVITGKFFMDRDEIASMLKKLGADVNTSISMKTDYVFLGEDAGPSKLNKLEEIADSGKLIRILIESDLEDVFRKKFDNI